LEEDAKPDMRMYMIIQHLFVSSLRLEQLMNRELERDGLTVKQFHLLWVIETHGSPPSIKEAASLMSSSHQNVKQIALKLERKGFLRIEKDEEDGRKLRLHLTDANFEYWKKRAADHDRALKRIFSGLTNEEISEIESSLERLRGVLED